MSYFGICIGTMPMPSTSAVCPVTCRISSLIGKYFQNYRLNLKICEFSPLSTYVVIRSIILNTCCCGVMGGGFITFSTSLMLSIGVCGLFMCSLWYVICFLIFDISKSSSDGEKLKLTSSPWSANWFHLSNVVCELSFLYDDSLYSWHS